MSVKQQQKETCTEFDALLARVHRKREIGIIKYRTPERDISGAMALIATPERIKMVRDLREGRRRKVR